MFYRVARRYESPARAVFLFYLGSFLAGLYWLVNFSWFAAPLLSLLWAVLYAGLIRVFIDKPGKMNPWRFFAVLTLAEILRSCGAWGFPWILNGQFLSGYRNVEGVFRWSGPLGASLFFNILTAAVAGFLPGEPRRVKATAGMVFASCLALLVFTRAETPARQQGTGKNVLLVQANFSGTESTHARLKRLREMIPPSSKKGTILVLPETVFQTSLTGEIIRFARELVVEDGYQTVIFGAVRENRGGTFNSIFFFTPDSIFSYDKRHLVPFGEFQPALIGRFTSRVADFRTSEFNPGSDRQDPVRTGDILFLPTVCFESSFPDLVSPLYFRYSANDAVIPVILTVTNDGWTRSTAAHIQHFRSGYITMLSTGLPWIRCGNSGVSGAWNPGDELAQAVPELGIMKRGTISKTFFPDPNPTFYLEHSRVINLLIIVSLLVLLCL